MKIESRPIDTVRPNPDNPRTITAPAFKRLVKSLQDAPDLFNARPLLCSARTGELIVLGGNMRLEAARELKYDYVPCIVFKDLTPEQEQEIAIKDNGAFGAWDYDALANEWAHLPLEEWGVEVPDDPMADDDNITEDTGFDPEAEREAIEDPTTQPGDVWTLDEHRVMCGDSTEPQAMALLMDGNLADCVWTDPPYGVGYADKNAFLNAIDKGNHRQEEIRGDHGSISEMHEIWLPSFANMREALKPGGVYYSTGPQGGDLLLLLMRTVAESGLLLKHMLIWVKNNHVLGRCDYNYKHEPILYGWKEGAGHYFANGFFQTSVFDEDVDLKAMPKADLLEYATMLRKAIPTTVLRENKPPRNDLHPTMKPIALVARMVRNSTDHRKPQLVLDAFGGSGTTLMACEQTGRTAYLMELDPGYCDVVVKRWEEFTGRTAERNGNTTSHTN